MKDTGNIKIHTDNNHYKYSKQFKIEYIMFAMIELNIYKINQKNQNTQNTHTHTHTETNLGG